MLHTSTFIAALGRPGCGGAASRPAGEYRRPRCRLPGVARRPHLLLLSWGRFLPANRGIALSVIDQYGDRCQVQTMARAAVRRRMGKVSAQVTAASRNSAARNAASNPKAKASTKVDRWPGMRAAQATAARTSAARRGSRPRGPRRGRTGAAKRAVWRVTKLCTTGHGGADSGRPASQHPRRPCRGRAGHVGRTDHLHRGREGHRGRHADGGRGHQGHVHQLRQYPRPCRR